jgi:hypothetical protein
LRALFAQALGLEESLQSGSLSRRSVFQMILSGTGRLVLPLTASNARSYMSNDADRLKKRNGFSTFQRISAEFEGVVVSPINSVATSHAPARAA